MCAGAMRMANEIRVRRIYDPPEPDDGMRVLVDRLWPRGIKKQAAQIDDWMKEIAPSEELRRWYDHEPRGWAAFEERYREELREPDRQTLVDRLAVEAAKQPVTLLCAAKDAEHSNAAVLAEVLRARVS